MTAFFLKRESTYRGKRSLYLDGAQYTLWNMLVLRFALVRVSVLVDQNTSFNHVLFHPHWRKTCHYFIDHKSTLKNCLFKSLSMLTTKQLSKSCMIGPLCRESIGIRWIFLHQGWVMRNVCPCHDVTIDIFLSFTFDDKAYLVWTQSQFDLYLQPFAQVARPTELRQVCSPSVVNLFSDFPQRVNPWSTDDLMIGKPITLTLIR